MRGDYFKFIFTRTMTTYEWHDTVDSQPELVRWLNSFRLFFGGVWPSAYSVTCSPHILSYAVYLCVHYSVFRPLVIMLAVIGPWDDQIIFCGNKRFRLCALTVGCFLTLLMSSSRFHEGWQVYRSSVAAAAIVRPIIFSFYAWIRWPGRLFGGALRTRVAGRARSRRHSCAFSLRETDGYSLL